MKKKIEQQFYCACSQKKEMFLVQLLNSYPQLCYAEFKNQNLAQIALKLDFVELTKSLSKILGQEEFVKMLLSHNSHNKEAITIGKINKSENSLNHIISNNLLSGNYSQNSDIDSMDYPQISDVEMSGKIFQQNI
ncbi:MAG: hypothetical protein ISN64_01555 [Rickettsia sp.]|nr:hypothetical protein [Rickettsia sp.]